LALGAARHRSAPPRRAVRRQTLGQALLRKATIQWSAPWIGISLNSVWVPERPTPVGRAAGGPQTNGKAERFIKTILDEWAHGQPYTTNEERQAALPVFVEFYNRGRPHTALGGAVTLRCCQQRLWGSQLDQLRLGTEMPLDSVNRLAQFSARGLLPPLRPSPLRRPSCSARLAV
jgi:hypothetical protein